MNKIQINKHISLLLKDYKNDIYLLYFNDISLKIEIYYKFNKALLYHNKNIEIDLDSNFPFFRIIRNLTHPNHTNKYLCYSQHNYRIISLYEHNIVIIVAGKYLIKSNILTNKIESIVINTNVRLFSHNMLNYYVLFNRDNNQYAIYDKITNEKITIIENINPYLYKNFYAIDDHNSVKIYNYSNILQKEMESSKFNNYVIYNNFLILINEIHNYMYNSNLVIFNINTAKCILKNNLYKIENICMK